MKNRTALLCALACGIVAGLPWVVRVTYSRGYDFFLWIYNAWYFRMSVLGFEFPDWSHYAAAGQPFFKVSGLSDCVLLAILSTLFGPWGGAKVFVLLFYAAAAIGVYALCRHVSRSGVAGAISAAAFVFSWFLSITVYFQGYLSNFMIYATLPWFIYCLHRGLESVRVQWVIPAGFLLCLAITANPQVAIKGLCAGSVWALVFFWQDWNRRHLLVLTGVVVIGLALSLFDIVSALSVRSEVLTVSNRTNSMRAPWDLLLVPAYALNLITYNLFDVQFFDIQLRHLRFSGYPGVSVIMIALASIGRFREEAERAIPIMWWFTGALYFSYWVLLGLLPASSWIGISHNLLVFPTLTLAILCGFGARYLCSWSARRCGERGRRFALVAVAALIFIDLGGAGLALNRFGVHATPPEALPEVEVWRAVGQSQGTGRFFSYNPDHTVYLYPSMTGRPTANVIDLRQRNAEYQSYLTMLARQLHRPGEQTRPSTLLALLNITLVDVPEKAFTYRGSTQSAGPYDSYEAGLKRFESDKNLIRVHQRSQKRTDGSWDRLATRPDAILQQTHHPERITQVVFENRLATGAWVADDVVVILGKTLAGEQAFETVALMPGYELTRAGYLLIEEADLLTRAEHDALRDDLFWTPTAGSVPPAVTALYDKGSTRTLANVSQIDEELVEVAIERSVRDRFVFVSQQFFRSLHAYNDSGGELPMHKAGAGLLAVFVPADTETISIRYEISTVERAARWVSVCAFAFILCYWVRMICKRETHRAN